LRHEYAHAFRSAHPRLILNRNFSRAFEEHYESETNFGYDPRFFVSKYAASKPKEDFAETFMYFVKHRGVLPPRFDTPVIRRKWRFIDNLRHSFG
jgi:hypothetical protein